MCEDFFGVELCFLHCFPEKEQEDEGTKGQTQRKEAPRVERESQKSGKGTRLNKKTQEIKALLILSTFSCLSPLSSFVFYCFIKALTFQGARRVLHQLLFSLKHSP